MPIVFASVVVLFPLAVIVALLLAAARLERARETRLARQVAVTDAIHRELGAVVAPVVEPLGWRAVRLRIAVPFERPALVARVLAVAQDTLAGAVPGRVEIVLVPQRSPNRN